jgi:acetylornithine deacetylase/succinyl-diaminopimelate desuccinylase-like protein
VLAVEATAKQAGGALVATVGLVEAHPGAISIVPGHCVLGIDIRDTVAGRKREAKDRIMRAIEDIARRRGLRHEVTVGRDEEPCPMTSRIIDLTVESAAAVEVPFTVIESRTGHDTASLASLCQTGMIMVRNRSGRSHSPDEDVDASDIAAGARVLGEVLLRLADEAESE